MLGQQHTRHSLFSNLQRQLRQLPGALHAPVCYVPLFRVMEHRQRNLQPHMRDKPHQPSKWGVLLPKHQRGWEYLQGNMQQWLPWIAPNKMRNHWSLGGNVRVVFGHLLHTPGQPCQRCLQLLKPICSRKRVSGHLPAWIFRIPPNNMRHHWSLGHYLWLLPCR